MIEEIWDYMNSKRKLLDHRIKEWLKEIGVDFNFLHKIFEGGKRLRSILTLLVGEALGYKNEQVIDFATAIEFVHNATLIHDDIIDLHTVRRGATTLWKEIGAHDAVITGDLLFTFTGHKLSLLSTKALEVITRAIYKVTKGVFLETNPESGRALGHKLYAVINELKTAELFAAASKLGAILEGNENLEEMMYKYGLYLGEAYQYADDLVDIIELEKNENYQEIDLKPIKLLISYIQKDDDLRILEEEDKGKIVELIKQLDAKVFLQEKIREKIRSAEMIIRNLPENKYTKMLIEIPKVMVEAMLKEAK